VAFGIAENIPIGAVNDARSILADPHFQARLPWLPADRLGADLLPLPIRFGDVDLPATTPAPGYGEHTDSVLAGVLGYDADRIAQLRDLGVLGDRPAPAADAP
jgi:crotonobetainyl-CoA:carnitine CoA-transferase CaiB-like acyl-CoA transferase